MNRQRDVPDLPDHYVWGWGALRGHRSHLERAAGGPGMQDWREGLKKKLPVASSGFMVYNIVDKSGFLLRVQERSCRRIDGNRSIAKTIQPS